MIHTNENKINYELNRTEHTAKVTHSPEASGNVFIPKFIKYDLHNYLITSIGKNAFKNNHKIITVEFPKDSELLIIESNSFYCSSIEKISIPDQLTQIGEYSFSYCNKLKQVIIDENSKLRSIGKMAFSYSSLESITIPSNAEELSDKWCFHVYKLTNITISPLNDYFIYFNNNMILKKSNSAISNSYDNLIFARRNIITVFIPSFIKKIGSDSFSFCTDLEKITFTKNSCLQSIEGFSFYGSSIREITIPIHVISIGGSAFYSCKKMTKIKFIKNSELKNFGVETFSFSSIEKIRIPPHVKKIESGCFSQCFELKKIKFDKNSELDLIEKNAFKNSALISISFPVHLKKIEEYALSNCVNLCSVEFLSDDVYIESFCFNKCESLKIVAFPNSKKITMNFSAIRSVSSDFVLLIQSMASVQEKSCHCLFQLDFESQSD